ncbi:hypothetical protein AOLI_G00309440 [Acnodon oligacanthus]
MYMNPTIRLGLSQRRLALPKCRFTVGGRLRAGEEEWPRAPGREQDASGGRALSFWGTSRAAAAAAATAPRAGPGSSRVGASSRSSCAASAPACPFFSGCTRANGEDDV